jgi:hypothetical protein
MSQDSIARRTLQKAYFFLAQAEQAGISKRDAFVYNLEAAIIFGRSVPDHLAKQYTKHDRKWCTVQRDILEGELLFRFLRETRNFILKEGPLGVRRVIRVTSTVNIILSGSARVQFIRGTPWYRRTPSILWEGFSRAMLDPIRRWRETRKERRRVAMLRRQLDAERIPTKDEIYLADTDNPAWRDKPAVQLIQEYLDRLTAFVDAFEARFGARD